MSTTVPNENLLQQITQHVLLVMLRISWPKLTYQISDAIVSVAGEDDKQKEIAERFRSNPRWQLMPTEYARKFGNIESRTRSVMSVASVNFAVRGVSVLPITRATEVFRALRAARTEMETERDLFVTKYAEILTALKTDLGDDLYGKAAKKIPTKEEISAKFSTTWAIVPIGGGVDRMKLQELRTLLMAQVQSSSSPAVTEEYSRVFELLDELESRDVSQVTDQEADELVLEAHTYMQNFAQDMLEDMAREPRQMLAEASQNLIEALQDKSRVIRNGTIDQVRRAFDMVSGFSFLAGPELLAQMQQVRERLDDATPQLLNSNAAAGAALANALRGVRDTAEDAQSASEAMRNFRGVHIRERSAVEA